MEKLITNCGLVALRNISEIKDISVRSLINIADDNGIKLYPYLLEKGEARKVKLPAIFHNENHFSYVNDDSLLSEYENNKCTVLLMQESSFSPISVSTDKIMGASWVAVAVGGAAVVGGVGKAVSANSLANKQRKALDDLKESNYIAPGLLQATDLAQKRANATKYAGQDQDQEALQRNAANAFNNVSRGTTSGVNLTNAAMQIQGNQNQGAQSISRNLQNFNQQGQRDFTSMLIQQANQQNKNREQYLSAKSALQGAIMNNEAQRDNAWWNLPSNALSGYTGAGGNFDFSGLGLLGGKMTDNVEIGDPTPYNLPGVQSQGRDLSALKKYKFG